MLTFIKDPASPEVIEQLKKEGSTLLQVTTTRLYILEGDPGQSLEALMHEWFVKFAHSAHAYRDGSHIGGGDTVQEVKVLTEGGRVVEFATAPKREGQVC